MNKRHYSIGFHCVNIILQKYWPALKTIVYLAFLHLGQYKLFYRNFQHGVTRLVG